MTISPDFSTAALVLAAPLVAYLVAGEPWLGRRTYAALGRHRDRDPRALVRYFSISLGWWLTAATLTGAAVAVSPGVHLADLGLTAPDELAWTAGLAVVVTAMVVWTGVRFRQLAQSGKHVPGQDAVAAMLPRTPTERRLAAVVAVADAICGELVYRGLLIALGVGVLGLHPYVAAGVALLVFAAAGAYQGVRGVIVFAPFGGSLTVLCLMTGSLLLPIIAHAAISVRDLVIIPAPAHPGPRVESSAG